MDKKKHIDVSTLTEKQKEQASKVINKLQKLFPAAFPHKPLPKVPLAIGTGELLKGMSKELKCSMVSIDRALALWCTGFRYLHACTIKNAPRYNIYGKVDGFVSKKSATWAQINLKKYILEQQENKYKGDSNKLNS